MQVTNVRTTVVGTPWRDLVFVELETDTGLVGVGEVRPVNKTDSFVAAVEELAGRYVVGADPFDTERLAWAIERLEYGRPSEHGQSALAAFDIASLGPHRPDARRARSGSCSAGAFRDRVPAYANGWYQADFEPDADRRAGAGRRRARLPGDEARPVRGGQRPPVGRATRRRALAVVAAVREAIGPGHRPDDRDARPLLARHRRPGRGRPRAVRAALDRGARPARERGRARSRPRAPRTLSIATGERIHSIWDAAPFIEGGDVDIIQADLTHFGGFTGMRRLAGWTEAHYLTLAPHNVGGPVATAANVHFAVATRNVDILEHFNDFADPWVSELVDAAPRGRSGRRLLRAARAARARAPPRPRRVRPASADRRPAPAVRRGLAEARRLTR